MDSRTIYKGFPTYTGMIKNSLNPSLRKRETGEKERHTIQGLLSRVRSRGETNLKKHLPFPEPSGEKGRDRGMGSIKEIAAP